MLQKSTLLSVSIFVLFFIGLNDYGYGCHKDQPHGKDTVCLPPEPGPPGGGGGSLSRRARGAARWRDSTTTSCGQARGARGGRLSSGRTRTPADWSLGTRCSGRGRPGRGLRGAFQW